MDPAESAISGYWTRDAAAYLSEHGDYLGDTDLLWCPEGVREGDAHYLGDVSGRDVLEVGCGAAQGARWVAAHGGHVVGLDLSAGMVIEAQRLNAETGIAVPLVRADARVLPFAPASFDVVFTAYGAIPFVPDPARIFAEVARVLRPGGRWVFSTSHPFSWVFPDDADPGSLRVIRPYADPVPYEEFTSDGRLDYVDYQHTMATLVNGVIAAGLSIDEIIEPAWQSGMAHRWSHWSAERIARIPGTLIVRAHRP